MNIYSSELAQAIASTFNASPESWTFGIDGVHQQWRLSSTDHVVFFHVIKQTNEREGLPGRGKWTSTRLHGIAHVDTNPWRPQIKFLYLDDELQQLGFKQASAVERLALDADAEAAYQ